MATAAGCTVLVVEDSEDAGEIICAALATTGRSPVRVRNGMEALEFLLANESPDLIVLDLMMPVLSGWELLALIRRHSRLAKVPVIVTSATDERPSGAVAYLPKPFGVDALFAAVRQHC